MELFYITGDGLQFTEILFQKDSSIAVLREILSADQRISFTIAVIIFLTLGLCANIATLYANFKRKLRPFFRACLLSLAFSDIFTVIFTSTAYLATFTSEFPQKWILGATLCSFIPFVTTTAIIVNSMTLFGIAVDRYMAMVQFIRGTREPGVLLCCTIITLIWGTAAGIASPILNTYSLDDVFAVQTDPENSSIYTSIEVAQICWALKTDTSYYYSIVFMIIFLPIAIAFVFLNSIIAREVWRRRKGIVPIYKPGQDSQQESSSDKRTTSDTLVMVTDSSKESSVRSIYPKAEKSKRQKSSRETRHLRMFVVIILLMSIFLICRLPTWINLLVKTYNVAIQKEDWTMHFSFGIISLANCFLNPLMYTFLLETIQYTLIVRKKIKDYCNFRTLFCHFCKKSISYDDDDYVRGNGSVKNGQQPDVLDGGGKNCEENREVYTIYGQK